MNTAICAQLGHQQPYLMNLCSLGIRKVPEQEAYTNGSALELLKMHGEMPPYLTWEKYYEYNPNKRPSRL